jgi:hypothetical protein
MRAALCATVAVFLLGGIASARGQDPNKPQASDPAKVALIHQLLTQTHSVDLAMSAMEASIPAQRAANPRIPAAFWDRFLAEARNQRGQLEDMLVDVYDHHFSSDEIRQLIAFYQTPVGRKMVSEMPAVMQESMQAGRQWGGSIGASVGKQLESEGATSPP